MSYLKYEIDLNKYTDIRINGGLELTPTDATHVHVGTKDQVVLRGVMYDINIHYNKWSDGKWQIGLESQGYQRSMYATIRKVGAPYGKECPSDSARKVILEEVERIFRTWIATHDTELTLAQLHSVNSRIDKVKHSIADLTKQLEDANRQESELIAESKSLMGKLTVGVQV